jgi:hypothetical protein
MTLQKKYLIGFILIVAIGVAVMIADDAGGSIAMSSRDGWEGPAHFRTDIKCDSAIQYYVWPDTVALCDEHSLYRTALPVGAGQYQLGRYWR